MATLSPKPCFTPYGYAFPSPDFPLRVIPFLENARPIDLHTHAFHELVIVSAGSAVHRYGASRSKLAPRDVFVVPPGYVHSYSECVDFGYCNVLVDFKKISLPLFDLTAHPVYQKLFVTMPRAMDAGQNERFTLDTETYEHCAALLEKIFMFQVTRQTGNRAGIAAGFIELLRLICQGAELREVPVATTAIRGLGSKLSNTLGRTISVAEMCKMINISRSALFREFKRYYGTGPVEFHLNHRLNQAASLLSHSKYSIYEIACQCGFSSGSYFTAMFRKNYGVTPLKYRAAGLRSER